MIRSAMQTRYNFVNPMSLGGCVAWIDFGGEFSTIGLSGGKIATLTDATGGAWAPASAGKGPTPHSAFLNGYDTATFASQAGGTNIVKTFTADLTAFTVLYLVYPTTKGANDGIVCSQSGLTSAVSLEISNANLWEPDVYWNGGPGAKLATGAGSLPNNQWSAGCVTYSSGAGAHYLWNNLIGTDFVSLATTSQASGYFPSSSAISVGNTGTNTFRGDMAQIIIYNRPLDVRDRTALLLYWQEQYDLLRSAPTPGLVVNCDFSGVDSTVSVSGGKITQVTDGSGNGHTFAQATAGNRFTQNVGGAPSGINCATSAHDAAGFYMTTAALGINYLQAFTLEMVVNPTTTSAGDGLFSSNSNLSVGFLSFSVPTSGNAARLWSFFEGIGGFAPTPNDSFTGGVGTWYVLTVTYTPSVNGSAALLTWYINNVSVATTTQKYGYLRSEDGLFLGGNTPTLNFQGNLGQFKVWAGVLSTGDRTTEYNAMVTKWGL